MRLWNPCKSTVTLQACALLLLLAVGACATSPAPEPLTLVVTPRIANPPPPPADDTTPATQQATLQELVALQERLYRVAAPLLLDNASLCKHNARNLLGFSAKNKYSYSNEFADSAQKTLGLDEQLQVTGVMAGSGAAGAGVRSGDRLVAIEDKPVPQGQSAEHQAGVMLLSLLNEKTAINMVLQRGGADLPMKIPLTYACAFIVELGNTDNVNAYADDHRIMVTKGMMHFAKSDEDLAVILATEMAHNVARDAARLHVAAAASSIIDNLSRMHSEENGAGDAIVPATQDMNIAADRLGLYMAARAGYGIDHADQFWSQLAAQYPASDRESYTATHPLTPLRLSALAKTVIEIKGKQIAKKPLLPGSPAPQIVPKPLMPAVSPTSPASPSQQH